MPHKNEHVDQNRMHKHSWDDVCCRLKPHNGNNYYWSNIHKRKLLAQLDVRSDPDGQGSFVDLHGVLLSTLVEPLRRPKYLIQVGSQDFDFEEGH